MPKLSRVVTRRTKPSPSFSQAAVSPDWVSRTYCGTLEDMRRVLDLAHIKLDPSVEEYSVMSSSPINYALVPVSLLFSLRSLIEEVQVYGNRMEAGLSDSRQWKEMKQNCKELKAEIKKLKAERNKLNGKKNGNKLFNYDD